MASYGLIRRTIIKGEAGSDFFIQLYKKDYTGASTDWRLQGEGFTVKWNGQGGTRDRQFIASECVTNFIVQNDNDEALLYDIFEKGDRNYYIRVYKNEETTNGIWWYGWVNPSFSTVQNTPYPYTGKISATDSIGNFKKQKDSTLTHTQYSTTSNINTHIKAFGDDMGVYQGWATNLVNNGYFSTPNTDWVLVSSTWTIPVGGGRIDGGGSVSGYFEQSGVTITSGQTVSFSFTISNLVSGSANIKLSNESGVDLLGGLQTYNTNGNFVISGVAATSATGIRISKTTGSSSYSLTNISVVDGIVNTAPAPQITNWFYNSIDWWRNGDEQAYNSDDPFYLYRTARTPFRKKIDKFPSQYSKYDVLEGSLKVFNTVGFLSNGRYNFMQPNVYQDNNAGNARFWQYASGGSQDTSSTVENHLLVLDGTLNENKGAVMSGSTIVYEPPFKDVSATFLNSNAQVNLNPTADYSDYAFVGNVQSDVTNTTGYLIINFTINHKERLLASELEAALTTNYTVKNHRIKTEYFWQIKLSDGTTDYWLTQTNSEWEWVLSEPLNDSLQAGYNSPSGPYNYETNIEGDISYWPCNINHTDGTLYYEVQSERTFNGSNIPLPPVTGSIELKLTGTNTYWQHYQDDDFNGDTLNLNTSGFTIERSNFISGTITDNSSVAIDEDNDGIQYFAQNSGVSAEELFDFGDILIGNTGTNSSANNQSQFNVQYLDAAGNAQSALGGFRRGNSGNYKNITQLLCNQYISLQMEPLEILQASIFSPDITPLKLLKYSISDDGSYKYYSFLGGTFNAQSETMSGEWYKVDDSTTHTILEEEHKIISTPTDGATINGVNTGTNTNIDDVVTNANAIAIINSPIANNTSLNKVNFAGGSLAKVYDNQRLIIRSRVGSDTLIVVVNGDQAKGSTVGINIDPITPKIDFAVGSTLSALVGDLTNVITGGGTPGGSNTEVQFNDNGSFEGTDLIKITASNEITLGGAAGTNANIKLNAGADIILGADTPGGTSSSIQYVDASGGAKLMLIAEATNKVVLCNRASNGEVQIRANTASAGGGGELTIATFRDTSVDFLSTAELRGTNIGTIYDDEMYLVPADFVLENASSGAAGYDPNGRGAEIRTSSTSRRNIASFQVPKGYAATSVTVYGSSATSSFLVYANDVTNTTASSLSSSTSIGSTATVTFNGEKSKYMSIVVTLGSTSRSIYGAKIELTRI